MGLIPWRRRESLEHPLVGLRDEMNRLFDSFWRGDFLPEQFPFAQNFPSVDVSETEDEIIVRAEVPGLEAEDLDLSITGDVLTIKGEKKEEKDEKEKDAHRREVRYGAFSRTVRLPGSVDVKKVNAECRKGVLKVTLGKTESEKAKTITVKGEKEK